MDVPQALALGTVMTVLGTLAAALLGLTTSSWLWLIVLIVLIAPFTSAAGWFAASALEASRLGDDEPHGSTWWSPLGQGVLLATTLVAGFVLVACFG